MTVACHHAERCWSSSPDSRTSAPLPNYPNVTMVYVIPKLMRYYFSCLLLILHYLFSNEFLPCLRFPPFPEEIAFGKDRKNRGIACHHPKLFILQREDNVRVIITSANLVARQVRMYIY